VEDIPKKTCVIGAVNKNTFGTDMKIIEELDGGKCVVEFQDDFKFHKEICNTNFISGNVKNPYDKTLYNIGYLGVGKYNTFGKNKSRKTTAYIFWFNLMERCYSEKRRDKHMTYTDAYLSDEWHNFQNIAAWVDENYYEVKGERMHLDKDILVKGNRVYSPDTCLIVPQRINMMFMTKEKNRDPDLPNAIYRCVNGFQASYNGKSLGVFKTVEDAVTAHDSKKRIHIKQVVEEYGDILPPKVREALLRW